MKKFHLLLFFALTGFFAGCDITTTPAEKTSQDTIKEFLINAKREYRSLSNDIQEKDYIAHYKDSLFHVFDSLGYLTNWKGQICDISRRDGNKDITVSFKIEIPVEQYIKLTLYCHHSVSKSATESDPLYQSLYNMRNYAQVSFDGFPRETWDHTLKWESFFDDDLCIPYPKIGFWVVNIRESSSLSEVSSTFIEAANRLLETEKLIRRHTKKEIGQKEYSRRSNELKRQNDSLRMELSEEERAYMQIISNNTAEDITSI